MGYCGEMAVTKSKDGTKRPIPPPDGICNSDYHYWTCGKAWRCPSQELRERKIVKVKP